MDEIQFQIDKNIGQIIINRPSALNAMTYDMVAAMSDQLDAWANDKKIQAVVISGAGERAFCAGGDIRELYHHYQAGNMHDIRRFFHAEYNLNYQIACYPKPYIAIIDGITMGGGAGVSIHGSHVIATADTRFAMPEAKIGFFPDIGAMHILHHVKGGAGKHMALTGQELNGQQMAIAGLASHFSDLDTQQIIRHIIDGDEDIDRICEQWKVSNKNEYDQMDVDNISINELSKNNPQLCPFSLVLIDRYYAFVKRQELDLKTVLGMDYFLVDYMIDRPDMMEGIRAMLIDKDRSPAWTPPDIDLVDRTMIDDVLNQAKQSAGRLYRPFKLAF